MKNINLNIVDSLSGNTRHLGNSKKTVICGQNLFAPKLNEIIIKYDTDKELKEFWSDGFQSDQWVIVSRADYCKKCLSYLHQP